MMEYFVHIDRDDPPKDLVVVAADIPSSVSRRVLTTAELPKDWRKAPARASLAAIGDKFATDQKTAILVVPSAIVPVEANWLINPLHPQFASIRVRKVERFEYDSRFFA
jgi:RES domain-containing protein